MPVTLPKITPPGFPIVSEAMVKVLEEVYVYAYHGCSCLITGPPGAGKEFIAKFFHAVYNKLSEHEAPYENLNCAGLTSEVAQSEIFGHVVDAFPTAHHPKKGLLEKAKGGILFLDELDALPSDVRPMLLRALDPDIQQATRIGDTNSYMTDNILVLGATENSSKAISSPLHLRFGKVIEIPGVSDRKEDIEGAVQYFAARSIRKRRDASDLLASLLDQMKDEATESLNGMRPSAYIGKRIATRLYLDVEQRDWSGNFREIKNTIDTAILHADYHQGMEPFVREVEKYYKQHHPLDEQVLDTKEALANPSIRQKMADQKLDDALLEKVQEVFPNISRDEQITWALILGVVGFDPFRRRALDPLFPKIDIRTLQNRIAALVKAGVLRQRGNRKEIYQRPLLKAKLADNTERIDFLSLDVKQSKGTDCQHEADDLIQLLHKTRCIHLSIGELEDPASKVLCIAQALTDYAHVFYYRIDKKGVVPLVQLIEDELIQQGILDESFSDSEKPGNLDMHIAALSGYIARYLKPVDKPILFLDQVDLLRNSTDKQLLNTLLRYWTAFAVILVGKKLGNEIEIADELGVVEYGVG